METRSEERETAKEERMESDSSSQWQEGIKHMIHN
jgi:hypothetical protein